MLVEVCLKAKPEPPESKYEQQQHLTDSLRLESQIISRERQILAGCHGYVLYDSIWKRMKFRTLLFIILAYSMRSPYVNLIV